MTNRTVQSGTPQYNPNELTVYHESGHAVMARLFGRCVHNIVLVNMAGTYNGRTNWGRDEIRRDWDPHIPYAVLQLRQEESVHAVPLIFAAGKAAERIWLRQKGLDETIASFGQGSDVWNDKQQLENEVRNNFPRLKQEEIPLGMQKIEDLAMHLLESACCWQVIEIVAQALLNGIQHTPEHFSLDDVQQRITTTFASVGH
jgi:hypothetical protein